MLRRMTNCEYKRKHKLENVTQYIKALGCLKLYNLSSVKYNDIGAKRLTRDKCHVTFKVSSCVINEN